MGQSLYVRHKGRVTGPFDRDQVITMIRRRQISRLHQVSDDRETWLAADRFEDLFDEVVGPRRNRSAVAANRGAMNPGASSVVGAGDAELGLEPFANDPFKTDEPIPGGVSTEDGSSTGWYARVGGETQGPVDASVIGQWIGDGHLLPSSLVWRSGYEQWCPAEQVFPQWFDVIAADASDASPPPANSVGESKPRRKRGFPMQTYVWLAVLAVIAMAITGGILGRMFGG